MRLLTFAVLSIALAGCRDGCASSSAAAADAATQLPSKLSVTELARGNDRFQGLAFDATHVYFGAMFHGSRRVPKKGGPIEVLAGADRPQGQPDPRRAYSNGYGFEPSTTADLGGEQFAINATSIERISGGKREALARSLPSRLSRKVLVVDDARVYWLEPEAEVVLSVPRKGGPVAWVCDAPVATHYDLALVGDRLYLVDISGSISSALKTGSERTIHGSLSTELGGNRNALWASFTDDTLYIVSDAVGYTSAPVVIELNKPVPSNLPAPSFESRVVKLVPPKDGVREERSERLLFSYSLPVGELDETRLQAALKSLDSLRAEIASGKIPITLSERGTDSGGRVGAYLTKVEAWLREHVGAKARVERVVENGDAAPTSVEMGVSRAAVPLIFAP